MATARKARNPRRPAEVASQADELLTVRETENLLGLRTTKLYDLMRSGDILSFKLGYARRISRDSAMAYREACKQSA